MFFEMSLQNKNIFYYVQEKDLNQITSFLYLGLTREFRDVQRWLGGYNFASKLPIFYEKHQIMLIKTRNNITEKFHNLVNRALNREAFNDWALNKGVLNR